MEYSLEGLTDTIAAISTPMNTKGGGIGIVRITGSNALHIASQLFLPKKSEIKTEDRKLILGNIVDPCNGQIVDEGLSVFMQAPRTYTREDVVEFHCHGGARIVCQVLEMIIAQGARIARPGEFTLRAFINGRIDLTRAEAVMDIIQARSNAGLRIAARQLAGSLEKKISGLLEELKKLETLIEAHIDFPEEEITGIDFKEIQMVLNKILKEIIKLQSTFKQGKRINNGFNVTIAGLPNVGKSSLMNCLLRTNRSIVAPIPGTTRDYIEEMVELSDIPVNLTDTAGIKTGKNFIEQESVNRSMEKIKQSDLVVFVLDSSKEMSLKDKKRVIDIIKDNRVLIVSNKDDIRKLNHSIWINRHFPDLPCCSTSAINGRGTKELSQMIVEVLLGSEFSIDEETILTNPRHVEALHKAKNALKRLENFGDGNLMPLTLISMDLNEAVIALSGILGIGMDSDVLERIFQNFCIGK